MHTSTRTNTKKRRPRILIAGLGNEILRDDGVGIHAVRALKGDLPKAVCAAEIGTFVLDALHLFEWADRVLVIDAVNAGGAPGTIYSFDINDADERQVKASLHELDMIAALRFLPEESRPQASILGIEPEIIDFGTELSATLQNSLDELVKAAKDIVERWGE